MFTLRKNRRTQEKALECAAQGDFQQIFTEDMAGLHLLAFLLTGDMEHAAQCFVGGLEQNAGGNVVFREWARAWSRRAIINNAIKTTRPSPGRHDLPADPVGQHRPTRNESLLESGFVAAVTRLHAFERFVLVMAVLEGYSLSECAALLNCPLREAVRAKSVALKLLTSQTVVPSGGANQQKPPAAFLHS